MNRLSTQLTVWSRLGFAVWRTFTRDRPLSVRLANGVHLCLRAPPARDLEVAEQVFADERFRPPRPLPEAPRIVDASAGCGFAVVYWVSQHPKAGVIAFEPHPDRVDAFVENTEQNALWDRVLLHPMEAGTSDGEGHLDGEEGFASIFKKGGASRFQTKRVDFFKMVGDAPISLLKLKVSGPEQPILADDRFAGLKVDQLVIEGVTPESRAWCERRLSELGYQIQGSSTPEAGLLWATAPATA